MIKQKLRAWLREKKYLFSEYKWYRKWYGGVWVLNLTDVVGTVWMQFHEYCPTLIRKIRYEVYPSKEKNVIRKINPKI